MAAEPAEPVDVRNFCIRVEHIAAVMVLDDRVHLAMVGGERLTEPFDSPEQARAAFETIREGMRSAGTCWHNEGFKPPRYT